MDELKNRRECTWKFAKWKEGVVINDLLVQGRRKAWELGEANVVGIICPPSDSDRVNHRDLEQMEPKVISLTPSEGGKLVILLYNSKAVTLSETCHVAPAKFEYSSLIGQHNTNGAIFWSRDM